MSNLIENGICPICNERLIYPRDDYAYCEDCGWPDEDFDGTYGYPEVGDLLGNFESLEIFNGAEWIRINIDDMTTEQSEDKLGYYRYKMK